MTDPEKITRIPKATTEIFDQQGFTKSRTDQIANQAQVSKGLLFHYSGSKQALYPDAFKYIHYRVRDHMDPKEQQNAPGLAVVATTAAKHGLKLQFKLPAEYRLMIQVHAGLPHFPEPLR